MNKTIGFVILLIPLITLIPFVASHTPLGFTPAIELFVIFLMLFSFGKKELMTIVSFMPIFFLVWIMIVFEDSHLNIFLQFLELFFWPVAITYIVKNNYYVLAKKLFCIVVFCYVLTAITTIIGNLAYPLLSRSHQYEMLNKLNVGGFNFAYELLLIIPVLIFIIQNNSRFKSICVVILFLFEYCIIVMQYSTAILLSFTFLILFIVKGDSHRLKMLFLLFIAFFFLFESFFKDLLVEIFQGMLSSGLEPIIPPHRIIDIINFLTDREMYESQSDLASRAMLRQYSLNNFLSNPLMGVGDFGGRHCLYFDYLSAVGLFGGIAIVITLYQIWKKLINPYKIMSSYLLSFYFISLLLAYLNPKIFYRPILIIIPLSAYVFCGDKGMYDSNN